MPKIDDLLRYLKDNGGSDLHLAAGREPRIRAKGRLESVEGWPVLEEGSLRELIFSITPEHQWKAYEKECDVDFAYGLEGVARFRVNYFTQERGASAVFRIIPEQIVPLEDLGLPDSVERLAHVKKGLVLMTGPTGSGKSTTLAAIIDKINHSYSRHIVTLEDPIEFVHKNDKCIFSHREIGTHTGSFGSGLRAAIRQDADVILVGEMRDYETISLAITAAEMGLLVFGTLHTNSAIKTIDRVIDGFPSDEQDQARLSLSQSLAAVVSQLLMPTADGNGRCAVVEVLVRTAALPNMIREGNMGLLRSLIQGGKKEGMQSMDDALMERVKSGEILVQEAYLKATDKARFEALLPQEPPPPPLLLGHLTGWAQGVQEEDLRD